jgi:DNA repair protein RadC
LSWLGSAKVAVDFRQFRVAKAGRRGMVAPMSGKTGETQDQPKVPHYHGHRTRLRERFRAAGADALSDYELLEMVLFSVMPRGDVKPLAKVLIKTFGSFAEAVHAPETRLRGIAGVGEATRVQADCSSSRTHCKGPGAAADPAVVVA